MPRTVHIIGAGLAGLAAAVRFAKHGIATVVHEATAQAGGRCRSYDDAASGMRIDNGTHILLSGNTAALAFLADIGATSLVRGASAARIAFVDLADGRRWMLDLGTSRIPLWMFDDKRRAPETRAMDYLPLLRLLLPGPDRPLADVVACHGPAYEKVVKPFLLATLNIDPSEGSSHLARAVVRETIAAGGAACRPYLAPKGLSAAFVDPALAHLQSHGIAVRFNDQLRRCIFAGGAVAALDFGDREIALGREDAAIVAVPAYAATSIIPELTVPDEYRAIINAHFNIVPPSRLDPMIGVVNGVAEWIFAFEDRISVTISGADRLLQHQRDEIARMIWDDVKRTTGIADEMPLWQIVRERRATFAATPAQNARRPGVGTKWRNLALAGDWTDTGLPATIESAVRSGNRAADFVLAM
jgi:squalene-associated FAD-dependent desaturase